jgi:nucleoside-diphosphate-sugar epimerase
MIRWIDQSIGTAAFTDFEAAGVEILDVRSMVDGAGNSRDTIRVLVEAGLRHLQSGVRLLVCCDHGISRSTTIAAGIIARRDGMSFDAAFHHVRIRMGEHRMDFALVDSVRGALEQTDALDLYPRRILVTGGTGFLGSWVRRMAPGDYEILAVGSGSADLAVGPFDLDRIVRSERPSVIIHLANPRIYRTSDAVPRAVAMLQNVMSVCVHHGTFLVFASSWSVLEGGSADDATLAPDDAPCRPVGPYALSKALCEHMIDLRADTCGLRASILRLSPTYGAGSPQPRFLFRIAEACRAGRSAHTHVYRNGRPRLQLLYVEDAARALIAAAKARVPGRFNVGGPGSATTHSIAQSIARVLSAPLTCHEIAIDADVGQVTLDCGKARAALGWTPEVSIDLGLNRLFGPVASGI